MLGVPMATLSLVDEDRQWFKFSVEREADAQMYEDERAERG